jgi:hypothetical protein
LLVKRRHTGLARHSVATLLAGCDAGDRARNSAWRVPCVYHMWRDAMPDGHADRPPTAPGVSDVGGVSLVGCRSGRAGGLGLAPRSPVARSTVARSPCVRVTPRVPQALTALTPLARPGLPAARSLPTPRSVPAAWSLAAPQSVAAPRSVAPPAPIPKRPPAAVTVAPLTPPALTLAALTLAALTLAARPRWLDRWCRSSKSLPSQQMQHSSRDVDRVVATEERLDVQDLGRRHPRIQHLTDLLAHLVDAPLRRRHRPA